MGIYVKGIELPKEPDEMIELAIFGDGRTVKTGESWRSPVDGKCYYGPSEDMNTYSAFAVPPHGRLGDLDKLEKMFADIDSAPYSCFDGEEPFYSAEDAVHIIRLASTIIGVEEGE